MRTISPSPIFFEKILAKFTAASVYYRHVKGERPLRGDEPAREGVLQPPTSGLVSCRQVGVHVEAWTEVRTTSSGDSRPLSQTGTSRTSQLVHRSQRAEAGRLSEFQCNLRNPDPVGP